MIATVFPIGTGNYCRGESTNWAHGVSAMTDGNILGKDRKNSCYCIYYPDILKLTNEH